MTFKLLATFLPFEGALDAIDLGILSFEEGKKNSGLSRKQKVWKKSNSKEYPQAESNTEAEPKLWIIIPAK